jgi:hypothetical protein
MLREAGQAEALKTPEIIHYRFRREPSGQMV